MPCRRRPGDFSKDLDEGDGHSIFRMYIRPGAIDFVRCALTHKSCRIDILTGPRVPTALKMVKGAQFN